MAAEASPQRRKILLVDDNPSFREMLVSWLATRYEVVEAASAEAGLEPARALFCNLEQIRHWSFRSDACATDEVPILPAHADRRMRTSLQASQ